MLFQNTTVERLNSKGDQKDSKRHDQKFFYDKSCHDFPSGYDYRVILIMPDTGFQKTADSPYGLPAENQIFIIPE